jgi:uncharacterized membrane protein YccC
MIEAITSNKNYFQQVANAFIGKPATINEYKVSRKNAFVALANLSDAFTRMLSEPKSKQLKPKSVHQFVVLNHMLTSHIATLSYYVKPLAVKLVSDDFEPLINNTAGKLGDAEKILNDTPVETVTTDSTPKNTIQQRVQHLLEARRKELQQGITESETRKKLSEIKPVADQFNFITNLATDIRKTSLQFMEE